MATTSHIDYRKINYDQILNQPIINTTANVDTLTSAGVYDKGDGKRYIVAVDGQTITQTVESKDGYQERTSTDGGTTWGEREVVVFPNGSDKWDKVIISLNEPQNPEITTAWLNVTDDSFNIRDGTDWHTISGTGTSDIPVLPAFTGTINGTTATLINANIEDGDGIVIIGVTSGTAAGSWSWEITTDGEWTLTSTATEDNVSFKYIIIKEDGLPFSTDADNITYDNTDSGLTATNVQDAIDELNGKVDYPQRATMPTASATEEGNIYQYVGTTTVDYTNGYFYKCVETTTPGTYEWTAIKTQTETVAVEDLTNYNVDANRVAEQYMVLKRNMTTQKWDKLPENSMQDKSGTLSFNSFDVAGKYRFNNCIVSDGHPAMLNLDGQGKVHGVLEVFESYVYNQTSTSTGGIVFQRFTTTNSGRCVVFIRRKAFGHNGTWGAWAMEQTSKQSLNRGKTYAFFGGSVCYNWNPFPNDATGYANEEILGVNSIRKRAISGAGWVAGNKIDNQITTELAETNPADVWVFWSSTNDHTAQVPIGDLDHKTDTTTVIGAMCNAIERVRTAQPTANILMTTPIRRFNNESGWNPYYDDGTTIPFYKYAEAVYTVANYYGIPVFDLWNNSGIDIKNYTTYMSDTIHPNASGYALFSRELCKFCADGHKGDSMPVIPEDKDTVIQVETLPTASTAEFNKIYQYIGVTDANYTNGFFYKCVSDGAVTPTYSRENIDVQIAKTTLVDLEDTTITSPTNGQVLTYNSTSQKWENTTFQGGAIQYNTNSPYKPGYFRVGTQAQYDALQQYYTVEANDTIFFTV